MRTTLKKVVVAILALAMVMSLGLMVACGDKGSTPTPPTVTLTLDKETASVEVGSTVTITATLTGSDSAITWTSSNPAKATVSGGVVTGVEAGPVTITASVGEVSASCEVTVTEMVLPVISFDVSSTQIYTSQTLDLHASVTFGGEAVTDATIVYASDDTDVATVSADGVITAVAKGSATITANCTYNGRVATEKSVKITVANLTVVSFVTETDQVLATGDTLTLEAGVALNGDAVTDPEITFSISDPDAAAITGNVLKALSAGENLVVTATYMDGEDAVTDSINLTIEYTVVSSGALALSADGNEGEIFIETDLEFETATLDGSAVELVPVTDGYTVDVSVFDATKSENGIILTDADGVEYLISVYTMFKVDAAELIQARPEAAYHGVLNTGASAFGRTGLLDCTGPGSMNWQNCFFLFFSDYVAQGYTHIALDIAFVPAAGRNFMGWTGSDGGFVNITVGEELDDDEYSVYDMDGNAAAFAASEWRTIVIDLTAYAGGIQFYSPDNFHAYIDNVRFMTGDAFDCFTNGDVYKVPVLIPEIAEVPLDNAIANPGAAYTLTRAAETEEYLGKTAIKFTGTNDSTWKNNLLINVAAYKVDYKWILVDFYFNSDTVMIMAGGDYAAVTYGGECDNGSYYVVVEDGGTYYSVPAVKNQWITIAFKVENISGDYLNAIMSNAVDTYVANITAVQETVFDEVTILPATANISLDNAIANPGGDYTLTRAADTEEYLGKTAIRFTGANDSTWKNNLLINVGEYKPFYKWVLVDFYFNSDTVMIIAGGDYAAITYGSACDNGAYYVVREDNGTYYSVSAIKGGWITIAFKVENISGDYINAIMSNAVDTYVANIKAVKASVFDDVASLPATANVSLDNAIANPGSAYTLTRAAETEEYLGKTAIKFTGANDSTWKNNVLINVSGVKYDYKWILIDFYFNSDQIAFYVAGETNNYAFITLGEHLTNGSFYAVKDVDGVYCSVPAVKNTWITLAFKAADMGNNIDGIMASAVDTYVSNIRAVDASILDEVAELPATLNVSLDNAIGNPGGDYRLTRATEPAEYIDRTAIKFTGTNEALWRNNLLINVGEYKADYKWVLVDFYFNSDDVRFMGSSDYVALTYGSECDNGTFYVVEEDEGDYVSVPAAKNQWITIAFKLSGFNGNYVNGIMLGAVDTYVANIRVVKASVLDEVTVNP